MRGILARRFRAAAFVAGPSVLHYRGEKVRMKKMVGGKARTTRGTLTSDVYTGYRRFYQDLKRAYTRTRGRA